MKRRNSGGARPTTSITAWSINTYDRIVLGHARTVVLLLVCLLATLGYRIKDFGIDASADTLILEHDADLKYSRSISERYGVSSYLFLTYAPHGDLLADETLVKLAGLRDELKQLDCVSSVTTILDVPLLRNPPVSIKELQKNIKTLESPDVDKEMARKELQNSPLYRNLLVSPDMRMTAIQINLISDTVFEGLKKRRAQLLDLDYEGTITSEERAELAQVAPRYDALKAVLTKQWHDDIGRVRDIVNSHKSGADVFLGGVPMIADDMVSFVKRDLRVFGLGMLTFLILALAVIFKRTRWVVLPMLCCVGAAVAMMGGLGIFGWKVTVVSSNFISLQMIISMALAIHLTVRYRELNALHPEKEHRELIRESVRTIFLPCLYTALTTIAGFCSLMVCDILPVINFGLMMTMGIVVSLFVTFLLFPACLMLVKKTPPSTAKRVAAPATELLARFTHRRPGLIFGGALLIAIATTVGISRIRVENSFINYFKDSTEIHRGMTIVDRDMGGTTPLDVIIDFGGEEKAEPEPEPEESDSDDFFEEFEEFESAEDDDKYWYTPERMELIGKVHDHLDSLPEIGKVLSLSTMLRIANELKGSTEWDSFELALLFNEFPADFRRMTLDPYVSIEHDQARFALRIRDSMKSLRRNELLQRIREDLADNFALKPDQIHLAGMMVLYNNMLQSLFKSQIQTVGYTVLAIMAMFMILFRSLKISLIAIFPNLMASLVILGVMGLLDLPLDMMTITIVAISMGIAVDNTIHYIHRFKHEFEVDHDYMQTMFRCHGSIGNALYYTSVTIIVGFSILALSEFIPSILFGLLTGLAMAMALLAALTLLPRLIIFFKPFGPERATTSD
ncbi:MAG: MMPL family transporter [Verrucomicrobia bacterium]|nr:MMPL family transporter [Verrucomicrobiota bacterium]MBT7699860.1 MMPL family transporter [Verrucomicrobiota bacterium]